MAIIGYINNPETIRNVEEYKERMYELGCQKIYEDEKLCPGERLQWRYILENKNDGDTIIIYKLSNALGGWVELPMFLNLCNNNKIRLISLQDGIDTDGKLYDTSLNDFLKTLTSFGNETYEKKRHFTKNYPEELLGSLKREQRRHEKNKLEKTVINDYQADVPLDQISKNRGVPPNTLYRMLRRHGLSPDRCIGKLDSRKKK